MNRPHSTTLLWNENSFRPRHTGTARSIFQTTMKYERLSNKVGRSFQMANC